MYDSSVRNRSRYYYLLIPAAAMVTVVSLARWSRPVGDLGVVASEERLDIGRMRQNETAALSCTLTNRSQTVQTIRYVSAGCSCTDVAVDRRLLRPGESTSLHATFHSGTQRGAISRTIDVLYSEVGSAGRIRKTTIAFSANVTPTVIVTPSELVFDQTADVQSSVLRVERRIGGNVIIKKALATSAAFSAGVDNVRYIVRVRFDPAKYFAGKVPPELILHCDDPVEPRVAVPLRVKPAPSGP